MTHRVHATRPVRGWSISKSWAIAPPSGSGYDAAYIVRLADSSTESTHDLVVEYAAPSAVASVGYAEEIARRFIRRGDLPLHVVVDNERAVRVVSGGALVELEKPR